MPTALVYRLLCIALGYSAQALASDTPANVFNDQNYQPKGAHNSLPPPRRTTAIAPANKSRQNTPSKAIEVRWQWVSHRFSNSQSTGKKRNAQASSRHQNSGLFYYRIHGQQIPTATICNNYSAGSFIYRDCRKAARRHFQQQCKAGVSMACTAANMTP
ncbi:MAG: hypothetical protein KIG85_04635 [Thiopseudomonas sp.]|nr:hypothetical protein [Thiopseudomonas sp.]